MVKGVSRKVIVVSSGDKKLFDQAIFILREDAHGVTDEMLLKEAKRAIGLHPVKQRQFWGPVWACGGALAMGLVWLLTALV